MKEATPEMLAELARVGSFKEPHLSALIRADFRCEYCGQDLLVSWKECFNAQLDHIQPKSKGGSDEESNLAVTCITCNSLKWDYVPCGRDRDEKLSDAGSYVRKQRNFQEEAWSKYRMLTGRLESP